ncbi:MAG: PIN domain-containing protein [Oscillibacter sp.]|nr:PIN domain-containing protein [Oscillibacter sp.]
MPPLKNTVIFDTNMILRYLLNDNAEMAELAEYYLNATAVTVTIEVIAEAVYVLKSVYQMERRKIADTLIDFLELVQCRDGGVLRVALETYGAQNLDFVDCVLYGYHKAENLDVATFDKKLLKLLNG